MTQREDVIRAALERIAAHRFDGSCHAIDPKDCFDVYEEVARAALAHVDALPENDTEACCDLCGGHRWVCAADGKPATAECWSADGCPKHLPHNHRREAAEVRLEQIAELLCVYNERFLRDHTRVNQALSIARGGEPA